MAELDSKVSNSLGIGAAAPGVAAQERVGKTI
jgi:hypothetical protein